MYPLINISNIIDIYTFWVWLVFAWAVFFISLHQFALRKGLTKHIFTDIVWFTFSIFLSSRILFIIGEWREEKFIFQDLFEWRWLLHFLHEFFITDNYNLSLAGGIIGFFLVFLIKTWGKKKEVYLDIVVFSFLLAAMVGYTWALLGWQIYGVPFNSILSIIYDDKNSIVPFQNPLFPLPVLYIMATGWLYYFLHTMAKKHLPDGFIGYMGIGIYGIILFLFEFLNGSTDMIQSSFLLNMNQILGIFLASFSLLWLVKLIKA